MKEAVREMEDTMTIGWRCLLLSVRNPDTLLACVVLPVLMLLLFAALFGKLVEVEGIPYVNYIVPGVILQCFGQCSSVTAIAVNRDFTGGIMGRYSTMPLRWCVVLRGRILEALFRNLFTTGIVLLMALILGFRPEAGIFSWGIAVLVLAAAALVFSWAAVLAGTVAGSAEGAGGLFTIAVILPYLSSGFVPTEAMPAGLALFAEYQPMTPVIESVRGLLLGRAGNVGETVAALVWCVLLGAVFRKLALRAVKKRISGTE